MLILISSQILRLHLFDSSILVPGRPASVVYSHLLETFLFLLLLLIIALAHLTWHLPAWDRRLGFRLLHLLAILRRHLNLRIDHRLIILFLVLFSWVLRGDHLRLWLHRVHADLRAVILLDKCHLSWHIDVLLSRLGVRWHHHHWLCTHNRHTNTHRCMDLRTIVDRHRFDDLAVEASLLVRFAASVHFYRRSRLLHARLHHLLLLVRILHWHLHHLQWLW